MAKKIKKIFSYSGGSEGKLNGLGIFLFIIGIIGFVVCIIVSGHVTKTSVNHDWGTGGFSPSWIISGMICLVQGIAFLIILNAGADIIRLLKKLSGLHYGGEISKPYVEAQALVCSECGNIVYYQTTKCQHCGVDFETINKDQT